MQRLLDHLPLNLALGLRAAPSYPNQAVNLDSIEKSLNIYLHAMSRSCTQKVVASKRQHIRSLSARRHVNALVWQESEHAHLPDRIQRFDDASLNRDRHAIVNYLTASNVFRFQETNGA